MPGPERRPKALFLGGPGTRTLENGLRLVGPHHDHPVAITNDDVTSVDHRTSHEDGSPDAAGLVLPCSLDGEAAAEDGEAHRLYGRGVAHGAVDDEPRDPLDHRGFGQDVAPRPRFHECLGINDQHVAGLGLQQCDVDDQVVGGGGIDGQRPPTQTRSRVDRLDPGPERAPPSLRLMHRGGTEITKRLDDVAGHRQVSARCSV